MFRHWLTRTRAPERGFAEAALLFLHITAGAALVLWGLALPLSPFRIAAGLFVLYWVGWETLYTIGRFGLYLLRDIDRARRGEGES